MDDRVYSLFGNSLHVNEITGCVIWDGEIDRAKQPIANLFGTRHKVRHLVMKSKGIDIPPAAVITSTCENVLCVKAEHFDVKLPEIEKQVEIALDENELQRVKEYISDGRRQEWIAEQLGTSRSRVAKMARVLREREEEVVK